MKIQLSEIELTNGLKFWVRNNLDDEGLEINNALDSWLLRTEEYTALSFINYLKSKPNVKAVLVDAVVMPKIAEENYRRGLQFGIDYCNTQINILQEIYKDQPVTSLKAIQKYLDVKKQLVNERDSNFTA